ncbi:MAG: hypothetical protein AB3N14_01605 [Flavobacteriaceae bacterium]
MYPTTWPGAYQPIYYPLSSRLKDDTKKSDPNLQRLIYEPLEVGQTTTRGQSANISLYKNMHFNNTQKKNRNPSKKEKAETVDNSTDIHYEWLESQPSLALGNRPYDHEYEKLPVIEY